MSVQRNRMIRAVGVLAVGLMVLGLWGAVERVVADRPSESSVFSGLAVAGEAVREVLRSEGGGLAGETDALASIEGAFGHDRADAPPWFEEEVLPLDDVEELRANEEWSVVGFASDRSVESEFAWAQDCLAERGWALVQGGVEGAMSAVKEGGKATWLLFSCRSVGEKTCVVVQVAAA